MVEVTEKSGEKNTRNFLFVFYVFHNQSQNVKESFVFQITIKYSFPSSHRTKGFDCKSHSFYALSGK